VCSFWRVQWRLSLQDVRPAAAAHGTVAPQLQRQVRRCHSACIYHKNLHVALSVMPLLRTQQQG
jgi:hypothetical protein